MRAPPRAVSILDEEGWAPIEIAYKDIVLEFFSLTTSLRSVLKDHSPKDITLGGKPISEIPIRKRYTVGDDRFWIQEDRGGPTHFLLIENTPESKEYQVLVHYSSYHPVLTVDRKTILQRNYKPKADIGSPILSRPPSSPVRNSPPVVISISPVRNVPSPVRNVPSPVRNVPPGRNFPVPNKNSRTRYTDEECVAWNLNKTVNPRTKRKIAVGKKVYNELALQCAQRGLS